MKIERGIIRYNNRNEVIVRSPGHIYHLNYEDFYSRSLKENDKVLGVIINNKFSVCREFISDTGEFVYGFLIRNSNPGVIQAIPDYEASTHNPYESNYLLGSYYSIPLP